MSKATVLFLVLVSAIALNARSGTIGTLPVIITPQEEGTVTIRTRPGIIPAPEADPFAHPDIGLLPIYPEDEINIAPEILPIPIDPEDEGISISPEILPIPIDPEDGGISITPEILSIPIEPEDEQIPITPEVLPLPIEPETEVIPIPEILPIEDDSLNSESDAEYLEEGYEGIVVLPPGDPILETLPIEIDVDSIVIHPEISPIPIEPEEEQLPITPEDLPLAGPEYLEEGYGGVVYLPPGESDSSDPIPETLPIEIDDDSIVIHPEILPIPIEPEEEQLPNTPEDLPLTVPFKLIHQRNQRG